MKFISAFIAVASIGSCLAGGPSQSIGDCTIKNLFDQTGTYMKSVCYSSGQFTLTQAIQYCANFESSLVNGHDPATLTALGTFVPELTFSDGLPFHTTMIGSDCYQIINNNPWMVSPVACSATAGIMCEAQFPEIPNIP